MNIEGMKNNEDTTEMTDDNYRTIIQNEEAKILIKKLQEEK